MTDECTIPDEPVYFRIGMYEGITEAEALAQVGTKVPNHPWEIPVLKPGGPLKGFWKELSSKPRPSGEAMGFIEP